MALPNILVSEDQFRCSICLDVYNDPVSTPCGHNFCMTCIGGYWDSCDLPQCPLCKETFEARPNLCVNKSFAEIVEQFKSSADGNAKPAATAPVPVVLAVLCDICTENKLKAVKSCLTCLTSYCGEHITLHRFNKHTLSDPVNMEGRMCKQHERVLEVFCESDQTCICALCAEKEHRGHNTILIERACEEKRVKLFLHLIKLVLASLFVLNGGNVCLITKQITRELKSGSDLLKLVLKIVMSFSSMFVIDSKLNIKIAF